MKKLILVVLACALLASCSSSNNNSGSSGGGFNFDGTWSFRWDANGGTATLIVQQDGTSIRLYQPSQPSVVWLGTCDSDAGTFTAKYDVSTGYGEYVGQTASGDTMTGYYHVYYYGAEAWRQAWTATR